MSAVMSENEQSIRPATVAGSFYPENPDYLHSEVRRYLDAAPVPSGRPPKAIIVPHAGYVYSAPVAAQGYKALSQAKGVVTRVVLMGPTHKVAVPGFALSGAEVFDMPLAPISVDVDAVDKLAEREDAQVMDLAHAQEHSLEVQLPFIYEALGDVDIVPVLAGDCSFDQVADVLDELWGGDETAIVVSSDLSHYLSYDDCVTLDTVTTHAIETFSPEKINRPQACGRLPIGGLLKCAQQRSMKVKTLDVKNSGDTAGPRGQVVGYGSWTFAEQTDEKPVTETHGEEILAIAKQAIEHGVANNGKPHQLNYETVSPELADYGAAFVTLIREGKLRGCVGSIRPMQSLAGDIAENACGAAFRDNRFNPLTAEELEGLKVTVSVLTPLDPIEFTNEMDLLKKIEPGKDGLVIADKGRRALFLPQVWMDLPDPIVFLSQLKKKAALDVTESPTLQAWRFRVNEVHADPGAHAEITAEKTPETEE